MPWGKRKQPCDSGAKNSYGSKSCPRCGNPVTRNAFGFRSHIRACLGREITFNGETCQAIPQEEIDKMHPPNKRRT